MALFKRQPLKDKGMTDEQIEFIMTEGNRALAADYLPKSEMQTKIDEAIAQAQKNFKAPDVKETAEYKALEEQFSAYKTRQEARLSADYAEVKPKFFDAVYDKIDHSANAKAIKEQLEELKNTYEEFFAPAQPAQPTPSAMPQFGAQSQGSMPKGDGDGSFAKYWGYSRKE